MQAGMFSLKSGAQVIEMVSACVSSLALSVEPKQVWRASTQKEQPRMGS